MASSRQQYLVIVNAAFVVHVFLFWAAYAGQWCLSAATSGGVLSRCAVTGLSTALLGGIVFLLKRCLDGDTRTRFVFGRFRGPPHPAAAAFTEWVHDDPRVDAHLIASKHDPLPVDPDAQNALWDRLFRQNEAASGVEEAHWRFTTARDLATNWMLFGLCALFFVFWGHSHFAIKALFAVANIAIAVCLVRIARGLGIQLVKNVLIAECADS